MCFNGNCELTVVEKITFYSDIVSLYPHISSRNGEISVKFKLLKRLKLFLSGQRERTVLPSDCDDSDGNEVIVLMKNVLIAFIRM